MNKMKPFQELVPYEDALRRIQKSVRPVERKETVPIENALDRVLTEDIVARMSVPPFDRASMDGYAVKAEDTFGATTLKPKNLKLSAVLHAGTPSKEIVGTGQCIQVATGAPMPDGADAVVMVEFTEKRGDAISFLKPVYPGANISPKGEDIEEGQVVLRGEQQLYPARIGALTALGMKEVSVYEKPKIAVVPTGTEIQDVGTPLKAGHIYDVNSYTLSSIINKNGGIPVRSQAVPDTTEDLKKAVKEFLEYDMLVFSGGSSVGEKDLLMNVTKDVGNILFHGIQIKPGKPTLYALVDDRPVFGMPGYPTSCLLNAYLLLVPAIRKIARLPPRATKTVMTRLAQRIVSSLGRKQFLPVKLKGNYAHPVFKQSGAITSMTEAHGYIVLPLNIDVLEKNQKVTVTLFE